MPGLAERLRPSSSIKDWLPAQATGYLRPTDWLVLPSVSVGDQKFVGLHAVWNLEANFAAVNCAGAYTVDWGDGSAPVDVATGVTAYHNYVYTDLAVGTLCSRGYRQAIVTITPQAGQDLTTIDLYRVHNQSGLTAGYTTGWLDIRMAGSNVSTLTIATGTSTVAHLDLEQFEYRGPSALTTQVTLFKSCPRLASVMGTAWTSSITTFTSMFQSCTSLRTVPLLDTGAGTNFTSMFNGCTALQAVPLLNVSAGLTFTSMFSGCTSLVAIPTLNTGAGTNLNNMFNACRGLQAVPLLSTGACTNFNSMFTNCASVQTVALLNTAAGTNFTSMFNGCASLQSIPLLDTSAGVTFTSMFNGCTSLRSIPLLNTAAGVTFTSMFNLCSSLQAVPLLNTAAGTNFDTMFSECGALQTIAALNLSAATTISGTFGFCNSLQSAPVIAARTLSFASACLGPSALNALYTSLAALNKLSANAASCETSVADWTVNVVNCAVTQVAPTTPPSGTKMAALTSTASGTMTAAITTRIAVSASTQYTFVASVRGSGTGRSCAVAVTWYDVSNAVISTDTGASLTSPTSGASQLTVTATSPAGAVTVSPVLSSVATGAAQAQYFDAMGLFLGAQTTWYLATTATLSVSGNWGIASDTPATATAKGWTVSGS